jgi:hypothetical protein
MSLCLFWLNFLFELKQIWFNVIWSKTIWSTAILPTDNRPTWRLIDCRLVSLFVYGVDQMSFDQMERSHTNVINVCIIYSNIFKTILLTKIRKKNEVSSIRSVYFLSCWLRLFSKWPIWFLVQQTSSLVEWLQTLALVMILD